MNAMPWKTTVTTTLLTSITPIIWGTTFIVSSEILPAGYPLTTAAIRTLPAGLMIVILWRFFKPSIPLSRLLLLSLLNITAFQFLLFVAAARLPGGVASLVGAVQPLIMIFLMWWIEQHRPHPLTVIATFAGILGMAGVLTTASNRLNPMAILAAFVGTGCLAVGTFLIRRWRNEMPLIPFIGWKLTLGGIMLAVPAMLWEPSLPPLSQAQWMGYIYLSLLGTVVAYILWFRGLAKLSPVAVSALGLLSPVTAIFLGWYFLGEKLTPSQWFSIAVVLTSVTLLQISSAWKHNRPPHSAASRLPTSNLNHPNAFFAPCGDDLHRFSKRNYNQTKPYPQNEIQE